MNHIQKIKEYIDQEGILGISGAIFVDHISPKGKLLEANSTVERYCEEKAKLEKCTVEKYAEGLYDFITAEGKSSIGECERCYEFILEGEEHVCKGTYKEN